MIRKITIRNWRAYRDSTVDLDSPMVFFVAPNGVGKSSLYEAARHCLLGFPKSKSARQAIRAGSQRAEVSMELTVVDGTVVSVTRTLTRTGRTSFTASRGGKTLSEASFVDLLERSWSTDLTLCDRLAFGDLETIPRIKKALPIREHLANLLGVTPLIETARSLKGAEAVASKTVAALRSEVAGSEEKVASLEAALDQAETGYQALNRELRKLRPRLVEAERAAKHSEAWTTYRSAAAKYNQQVQEFLADVGDLITIEPTNPDVGLETARQEAADAVGAAQKAIQNADRAAAGAATASELLESSTQICPTCLRPMSREERSSALLSHGEAVSRASSVTEATRATRADAKRHLQLVTDLSRRFDRLQPPTLPEVNDPGAKAITELEALRSSEGLLRERLGEARAKRANALSVMERARSDLSKAAMLRQAAREELLLGTTASVFETVAHRYLADRIEPLTRDVAHRWKLLFGSEGLALSPTGEIRMRHGDRHLDLQDMSGGERAIAGIIVRMLVTASATRIPMVWFDEPLEHLDPRRRSGVAHTLVKAVAAGTVNQILVATYEEGIARRLALSAPDLVTVVCADTEPFN